MSGELSGGPTSEIEKLATGNNPFIVLLSVKLSVFGGRLALPTRWTREREGELDMPRHHQGLGAAGDVDFGGLL